MKQFLCFGIILGAPLFAGVRIQMESTDLGTGEVTKREILIDADRLRMNETGKNINRSVLFLTDGGRNRMVILDKDKNEYREIDQQTVDQMSGQVSAASAQMQAQMKNMTPEQRAMMEQMMKGRGLPGAAAAAATPERTVYTAKGSGSANGFSCTKYEGDRGAEKVSELCAAGPSELKFAASDLQVYEKMKEFSAGLQKMTTSSPFFSANTLASITSSGYSGLPVQETSFKGGKASGKVDVKSVDRGTFSNADFSLGSAKQIDLVPARAKGKQ